MRPDSLASKIKEYVDETMLLVLPPSLEEVFTAEEVKQAIADFPLGKSSGPDVSTTISIMFLETL